MVSCKFKGRLDILGCIARSPLGICHGWQNGQHTKNENLVSCFLAIGQASHYMQMNLQESSRNKWISIAIQSHVSHKGMWTKTKSLIWRNICIGCKMEHHQNNECFSIVKHPIVARIWFPRSEHIVCRLFRALHGLKQTLFNGFKKLIVIWRKTNYKSHHLMATCLHSSIKMRRWWY